MRTTSWLTGICERLFQAQARQRPSSPNASQAVQAEMLETRQLLSATMTLNSPNDVQIEGTPEDDVVTVELVDADNIRVRVVTGAETVEQVFARTELRYHIDFNAGGGNDRLTNTTDRWNVMHGGDGNDTLIAGTSNDLFYGENGDDHFEGGLGSDIAWGGDGNDSLVGGSGNDSLHGENGNDTMNADSGNDIVSGGVGIDSLNGGGGTDLLSENFYGQPQTQYVLVQNSAVSTDFVKNVESASIIGSTAGDTINLSGFTFPSTMIGAEGNDTLIGGSNADYLVGGAGADSLVGGNGNDSLGGGADNDWLTGGVGDDVLNGGAGSGDVVFEMANPENVLQDNLVLTDNALSGNGTGADRLSAIEFANLVGGVGNSTLDASAFTKGPVTLNGSDGDDSLIGSAANDVLIGGLGEDTLDGGVGIDVLDEMGDDLDVDNDHLLEYLPGRGPTNNPHTAIEKFRLWGTSANSRLDAASLTSGTATLIGGEGDDTLLGSGNNATLNGGPGIDWIKAGGNGNLVLVKNRLTGATTNLVLSSIERADISGDDGNNILDATAFAGGALLRGNGGNDTLLGGNGNDTLAGGAGDDSFVGGSGTDRGVAEADANLTAIDGQITGEGTDSLNGIEIAQLTGGNGNNRLDASSFSGKADLNGLSGSDTLLGTAKNDTLSSGGDFEIDSLVGGNGTDLLKVNLDGTYDLTNTALTRRSGNITIVRFESVESAYLSQAANYSELNASQFSLGPVTLIGSEGLDTLIGGTKSDFLDGRGGGDSVKVQGNFNFTLTDTMLQGRGQDTLANVEVVQITAGPGANRLDATGFSGSAFLYGGEGNDTILGGSGKDTLSGNGGDDSMDGGAGDDNLVGGAGNDTVIGGDGNDALRDETGLDVYRGGNGDDTLVQYATTELSTFDGEAGHDMVLFANAVSGNPVTVTDSQVTAGGGIVAMTDVEAVKFSLFSGRLDGSAATISIFANGSGLNDTLIGGAGNDTLNGQGGDDSIIGGGGNDSLNGGDGDDSLVTGDGNDKLIGGNGIDTVDSGLGTDTVLGHEVGE